jgi:hypothetical protein
MKQIKSGMLLFFCSLVLAACEQESYLKHSLDYTRVADRCDPIPAAFKVSPNFGRQRFEFAKCLPADFSKKQLQVERKGDTIFVLFPRPGDNRALFDITLDIESNPRYQYINVDGETYTIVFPDN